MDSKISEFTETKGWWAEVHSFSGWAPSLEAKSKDRNLALKGPAQLYVVQIVKGSGLESLLEAMGWGQASTLMKRVWKSSVANPYLRVQLIGISEPKEVAEREVKM